MLRDFIGNWRWLALRAAIAVLFGLVALIWPEVTLWALVVLWGIFATVDGIFAFGTVLGGRAGRHPGWWTFRGLVGLTIGIITFVWPSITAMALLIMIAIWAFITGLAQITMALVLGGRLRYARLLGVLGVLSVVLGIVLLLNPHAGAVVIAWIIGWYALVFGAMLFTLAFEARREEQLPPSNR